MKPVDPRLLRELPTARRPLLLLAIMGVVAGVATVAKSASAAGDMVAIRDIAGSGRLV